MNWHRGLFRLWLVAALAWMALQMAPSWDIIATDLSCMFRTNVGPWCNYRAEGFRLVSGLEDPQFWETLLLPPIALLLMGLVAAWILRGFHRKH
jgi:hypothetical protein